MMSNSKTNEKIFDLLIADALADVWDIELAKYDDRGQTEQHKFSDEFERNIRKIRNSIGRKERVQIICRFSVKLLVTIAAFMGIVFGGLLTRPQVYAAVKKEITISVTAPKYNVNQNGETYGKMQDSLLYAPPDLIAAIGDNGFYGYIRRTEADGEFPSSPEEALRIQEERENQPPRVISVYAEDGVTVLDTFTIGKGQKKITIYNAIIDLDEEGNITPENSFEFLFSKSMNTEGITIEFLSETEIKLIFDKDPEEREFIMLLDTLDIMKKNYYPDYALKFFIKTPDDEKEYTPDNTKEYQRNGEVITVLLN